MDLQPPSVLAQLPRPLHASTGKTHIGEVYSLADSKKRKRYEVAVAVDGEAVNIYNVQTPKLVTSYAVPPQSSFSCRPCAVRRKLPNKSSVKRQTYGAVSRPEQQVKCFVEETGGNESTAPVISSSSFSVKDSSSPTIFVGIVPTDAGEEDEKDPFDILSVHQDGRVRRLTPDLKSQRWSIQHSEIAKVCSTHEVHTCFLVEFEDAKKSLFKRRQDLAALALGDLTASGANEPSILLLVSHPVGTEQISLKDVKVQMFSVPAQSKDGRNVEESQRLRHLSTIDIPDVDGPKTFTSHGLQWNFHSGSAGLNLSFEQGFINFDLSQYTPSVTSKFILEDESFSSIMRISPQSVIGAGKSLVALYDTQYQSVQRSISVEDVPSAGSSGQTVFISYFAKLGIAVATKGSTLFSFDLSASHSTPGSSLKRPRDGLLIDAIGRGIGSSAAQWDAGSKKNRTEHMASLGLTSPEQVNKWNQLTNDLDGFTKSKDVDGFDSAVQNYFGTGESKTLPKTGSQVNPEMILFVLSKIFSLKETQNNDNLSASSSLQLAIELWPKITCDWLIRLGQLNMSNVEIAMRRSFKPRILPSLPTGSFTQAFLNANSSRCLIQVVRSQSMMNPDELAYALRTFLNMARSHSVTLEETAKTLTDGSHESNNDNKQVSSTEASLKEIFQGLNTTLKKINAHPLPTIIQSIRSALSQNELISLVHHLRLSLATGGYTSRFTENPPTPVTPEQTSPPLPLDTITNLLTASVDAIGPSGWISAAGVDDPSTREIDLIADMKSEISAALAGVEEATYLKGILREYLRFTDTVAASSNNASKSTETDQSSALVRHEKLNGADLIVYTPAEREDGDEGDATGKLLPLSLKAASADVSKTKVKKSTGEVKSRSSREMGYLRRKAGGKYSFERLIV
ncbi:hypothetical protein ASPWEDRAFT_153703 [Aspergillus wentii DTO 134E9]|uniref:Utp8 beta-propeller domain-containing protein n=1 Tax=Aspergillus wentii DTO 134E9 TaxID=1073089 RepID=A0A1L9RS40_ASPWE|nr:uncharacterized protein ASPWEDRAFT_153703 [Aspergillus wentii DTO 134E9]KAI9930491.1 hypothetical protein MW887_011245 [Aspergillus wentii]OJJ37647.1 hypothetical protein ASPWEDRAFT_153703 [Aspergillus wentii DTO 134E9]